MHLAQPGLMAGWLTGKIWVNYEIFFKICYNQNFQFFVMFNHYYSNMNVFKLVFLAKACFKLVVRSVKNPEPIVFLVNPYY